MPTKILYSVLNWGLGHASRSIPIINHLISEKKEIVIASDGEALILLKKEFPNLVFEQLPPYDAVYSKKAKSFDLTIFFQLKKFGTAIKKENILTKKLIVKHSITHIISDNRYGVYSLEIPTSIICHQINLQHKNKFIQKQMNKIHLSMLDKFKEIWVPDFEDKKNIAGNISSVKYWKNNSKNIDIKAKLKYIGALSRMKKSSKEIETKYQLAIVLSGPEPQRTLLENSLIKQALLLNTKIAFVRGTLLFEKEIPLTKNIKVFKLLKSKELNLIINQSKYLVCRAGYSSVMDLIQLEKSAILIPTPGQTEQEYLAKILKDKKWFYSSKQESFNLENSIKEMTFYKPLTFKAERFLLENVLENFFK